MSTDTGRKAEAAAAQFLQKRGHQLLAQNWRTRWCEIDLITKQDLTVYFVEVKFRQNTRHGLGLDYITPRKLQQMHFAAELWLGNYAKAECEYTLAAIEVSGDDLAVTAWLDDLA